MNPYKISKAWNNKATNKATHARPHRAEPHLYRAAAKPHWGLFRKYCSCNSGAICCICKDKATIQPCNNRGQKYTCLKKLGHSRWTGGNNNWVNMEHLQLFWLLIFWLNIITDGCFSVLLCCLKSVSKNGNGASGHGASLLPASHGNGRDRAHMIQMT